MFAMEWIPQYRVAFYDRLRSELDRRGIEMRLVHGDPPASRRRRRDDRSLPWAETVPNRFWTVAGRELTVQPVLRRLRRADLVVVQQEAGLALNYWLLLRSRFGGAPVALWGHGHNFNPREAAAPAEWLKRRFTPLAHWIFAYTERSAAVFQSLGVDGDRITVVQNSRAVASAQPGVAAEPSEPVRDLVAGFEARGARVGWMVSALDRWKRVELLVDILDATRALVERFEFVVLGGGADLPTLTEAARTRPWLHVPGPTFGTDLAALGARAEIAIHPGLVGLHVIDAFATATPMIIADLDYHSHEVGYLEDGVNAVVLPADASALDFAAAAVALLHDEERLTGLRDGCRRAAGTYTIDAMVERFADGIVSALAAT